MGDTKPLLFFRYKGEDIYLENVNTPTTDIQKEVQRIILDLDLKHSYRGLNNLSELESKDPSIMLVYKDKEEPLSKLLDTYNDLYNKLLRADKINDLEIKSPDTKILDYIKNEDDYIVHIETCRVLQDLHTTLTIARFNLLESTIKLHKNVQWSAGAKGQFCIRSIYLNNAIISYNSAFDLLLQSVWLGNKLFLNAEKGKGDYKSHSKNDIALLTDKEIKEFRSSAKEDKTYFTVQDLCDSEIDKVLNKCSLAAIRGLQSYKFIEQFRSSTNIAKYANKLKHKGGMRYEDFSYNTRRITTKCGYNSHSTLRLNNIDKIIDEVIDYHIRFVELINRVYDEFLKNIVE